MTGEARIEVAELVVPGRDAAEGAAVAQAFHQELARLWEADRAAGLGWTDRLDLPALEFDATLAGEPLGHALAHKVRSHALRSGEQP